LISLGRVQYAFVAVVPFLILCSLAEASNFSCDDGPDRLSCVEYVRNYDGDTITFNIQQVHPLFGDEIKVRVEGVDAAEMSSDNDCEKIVAERAKAEVKELLSGAERVDLIDAQRDKYFRVLADVIYDGRSLKEYLLKRNLAIPYDGKTKPRVDWCDFQ
jgi:micrococcal nuclease